MTAGDKLVYRIDAAFAASDTEDGLRTHLGGSIIGRKCDRAIWFSFRWMAVEYFEGRMLRLFARGQSSETSFAELLRAVGVTVWTHDPAGNQYRFSDLGGHFGGSTDGIARFLPIIEEGMSLDTPAVLEMKTHNDKSFKDLVKKGGVKESKPTHYAQGQIYMHYFNLEWCLYCAVNKNDDKLHLEYFRYDLGFASYLQRRAEYIVFGLGIPDRISNSPAWFECKFCPARNVCFGFDAPLVNCRTCIYSRPEPNGTWSCSLSQPEIETQPKLGCQNYRAMRVC